MKIGQKLWIFYEWAIFECVLFFCSDLKYFKKFFYKQSFSNMVLLCSSLKATVPWPFHYQNTIISACLMKNLPMKKILLQKITVPWIIKLCNVIPTITPPTLKKDALVTVISWKNFLPWKLLTSNKYLRVDFGLFVSA